MELEMLPSFIKQRGHEFPFASWSEKSDPNLWASQVFVYFREGLLSLTECATLFYQLDQVGIHPIHHKALQTFLEETYS